jgi:hypothetical protein
MNITSTYRGLYLSLSAAILFLFGISGSVQAQINYAAVQGTAIQSGGGTTPYGPEEYVDDTIPTFPAASTYQYTYVTSGGWIKIYFPQQDSINKVVFYKNDRAMTSCNISYWDAVSQSYIGVSDSLYQSYLHNIADSVTFKPVFTDTIMFSNVMPLGNPTFREIQVWWMPFCSGAPSAANITASNLFPCFGTTVFLHSLSNNTTNSHAYQWQRSTDGVTWNSIPGATDMGYDADVVSAVYYRVVDTCLTTGSFTESNSVQLNPASAVTYQSVPYTQLFDAAWITGCATLPNTSSDLPGPGWSNNAPVGDSSWRSSSITSTTNTAGWTGTLANSAYTPLGIGATIPNYSARLHTSGMPVFNPGNLDLYLDCSTPVGDKQLYFYMINLPSGAPGGDSLRILMSTDFGASWTRLGAFDTAGTTVSTDPKWRRKSLPIQTNSPNTIIRFQGVRVSTVDVTDLGVDSVYVATPCSGGPVAGTITQTTPTTACAGASFTLTTVGTTMAGGLVYQWQSSPDGTNWTDVTGGIGGNTTTFITPPLYSTTYFRLEVTCGASPSVYTNGVEFDIAVSPYTAQLPYTQSFESWASRCGFNTSIPDTNWTNSPNTGNNSWRRQDQGLSANWNIPLTSAFSAIDGSFYARFHSDLAVAGSVGNLDLLIDCSTSIGSKEVKFFYNNANGSDSLEVLYSADGGNNFSALTAYYTTSNWAQETLLVPSNSANTVIRFRAHSDAGTTDIGIDGLTILPPCSGTPVAGAISSVTPCPGINFTLNLTGYTSAASITFQWQSQTGSGPWTNVLGGTGTSITTNIVAQTSYRVIITCLNSGLTDTTLVQTINLASFYYCYCSSAATSNSGADIGKFVIQNEPAYQNLLSVGSATPLNNNSGASKTYTDNRNLPPTVMYLDSSYVLIVSQINSSTFNASTVTVWIDTNHNGSFDAAERFLYEVTSNASNPAQEVRDTILIPNTSQVGLTGLRVVLEEGSNPTPSACGVYANGETEDYLIDIRYSPCDGPANAGTAIISDTSSCVGYALTVIDTSHEKHRSAIEWLWQASPDGNTWADMPGTIGLDTISQIVTGPGWYRLRMVCLGLPGNTPDTTYSNEVSVVINPYYSCYCYSLADGGNLDSSDIGAFSIYNFMTSVTGPHILNPNAFRSRTDYTRVSTIELWADSTYQIQVYQILRSAVHADGKITLFMDFNNDHAYSAAERIWTAYTTSSNWFLVDSITIPTNLVPELLTGMRLIINNNTGPNIPSDEACGPYTSGETEDYVVKFHKPSAVGIANGGNLEQLDLYPNPTDGRFRLTFKARKAVENVHISVTNITGQQVIDHHFSNAGRSFTQELDLTSQPRGIYLVEMIADGEKVVRKVIVK